MFTQLTISHQNPEITCSLRALLSRLRLNCLKFLAEIFICWEIFLGRVVVGLNVDCPLLSSAGSLFLPLGSPPHSPTPSPLLSSPLFSPPSPALASNGLNRLASCQSRGLLWLCHKSARKNRNHLFRPGPERGWGCKYTSLAPRPHSALPARTGPPSPVEDTALPLSLNLHSHPQLYCSLQRFHG